MERNPATGEPMGDMPTTDELFQGDEETRIPPTPVELVNVARVDQVPRTFGKMDTVPLAANANATKILGSDPRRAEVTLWVSGADVVIASNQGSAQARQGATLSSGVSTPIHLSARTELWARPVAGASDTAMLSIVEELWAR